MALFALAFIGTAALGMGTVYTYFNAQPDYERYLPESVNVEYGEDPADVLGESLAEKFDFTYNDSNIVEVGKYTCHVGSKVLTVNVRDTISPEVHTPESLEFTVGEGSKKSVLSNCSVSDVDSNCTLVMEDVDFGTEGTYYTSVNACDSSGNSANSGLVRIEILPVPEPEVAEVTESSNEDVESPPVEVEEVSAVDSPPPAVEQEAVPEVESPPAVTSIPEVVEEPAPVRTYYNSLVIPSVGIDTDLAVGGDQASIDANDVCLFPQLYAPGCGAPILLGGHNTRSFGSLSGVSVGDTISLYWNGIEYVYTVEYSSVCTMSGPDLTDVSTGQNVLEHSGREVLQMYTCYGSGNTRWVVKAIPV